MRQLGYMEKLEGTAAKCCPQADIAAVGKGEPRPSVCRRVPPTFSEDSRALFNQAAQVGECLLVRGGIRRKVIQMFPGKANLLQLLLRIRQGSLFFKGFLTLQKVYL